LNISCPEYTIANFFTNPLVLIFASITINQLGIEIIESRFLGILIGILIGFVLLYMINFTKNKKQNSIEKNYYFLSHLINYYI